MALGSAMAKIEVGITALLIGIGGPFIITYMYSGGTSSYLLIPSGSNCTNGVCIITSNLAGTNNAITLPQVMVNLIDTGITLAMGILITMAMFFLVVGAIEYMRPTAQGGRGGV